jgi:hypothetical protein
MDKDHCYYFGSKRSHRQLISLSNSEENLAQDTKDDKYYDKNLILPQYRSNDSALDVTSFDSISDKCQSYENINVHTVDVFSDKCILPGISDPDLSRMSIQSQVEVETWQGMLQEKQLPIDHSYCCNFLGNENHPLHNQHTLFKDHGNSGVKRGHSNDDLTLLNHNYFKRKDFKKSPFLDHTYQSVELQSANSICKHVKGQQTTATEQMKVDNSCNRRTSDAQSQTPQNLIAPSSSVMSIHFFPKQPFLDHTYEDFEDATADISLSEFIRRAKSEIISGVKRPTIEMTETKTEKSDHSYVIKSENCDFENACSCSPTLSDSGTESLNEDEIEEVPVTVEMCMKEHPYSKSVKPKMSRNLPT